MDSKFKNNIVKTKSSNRSKATKSNHSNENVKPVVSKLILKRRGLYVERNPVKLKINEGIVSQPKSQRISSPSPASKNKFVSSVLTSSIVGNRRIVTHEVIKPKRKRFRESYPRNRKLPAMERLETDSTNANKMDEATSNRKINPKVLNTMIKNDDNIVFVLQSRNNIEESVTNSDSNRSKRVLDWSDSRSDLNDGVNAMNHILSETICSGIDKVAAEVLQGKMKRRERQGKDTNDPKTLVSDDKVVEVLQGKIKIRERKGKDTNDPKTLVSDDKVDDDLYNLCVDLLQTTMSGSDTKINHEIASSCQQESACPNILPEPTKRITFKEFDDSNTSDAGNNPSDKFYIMENNKVDHAIPTPTVKPPIFARKENLKTQSLVYPKKKKQLMGHSQSFNDEVKTRKSNKKIFIDVIKKELLTYRDIFEEPRSMFEALKVMARNKKRSQKHIYFNDTNRGKFNRNANGPNCELKSPKLIRTDKSKLNRNRLRVNDRKFLDDCQKQRRHIQRNKHYIDSSQESDEIDSLHRYKGYELDSIWTRRNPY